MSDIPDALAAAPDAYGLLLENDRVRVMDLRLKAGQRAPMHDHPSDHVVYVLSPARLRLSLPDGKEAVLDLAAGQTLWIDAGAHETENVGASEGHNLVVEIKQPR
jgi:quercetin dioxygenase-like cupin family protein